MNQNLIPKDETHPSDITSIEKHGFTYDYLNHICVSMDPIDDFALDFFIKKAKAGKCLTYTEAYQDSPQVLQLSNPELVKKIDTAMEQARTIASSGDRELLTEKLAVLQNFFKS